MMVDGFLFADETHYSFFKEKIRALQEAGYKPDTYAYSVFYLFGVCHETRLHFEDLFSIQEHVIRPNALEHGWQTGTTRKIARLAFNLWNGCCYESEDDAEQRRLSPYFCVDEIFCCCFQEFFFEAVRLRFPEYSHR